MPRIQPGVEIFVRASDENRFPESCPSGAHIRNYRNLTALQECYGRNVPDRDAGESLSSLDRPRVSVGSEMKIIGRIVDESNQPIDPSESS